jgi:hypothetical protein
MGKLSRSLHYMRNEGRVLTYGHMFEVKPALQSPVLYYLVDN